MRARASPRALSRALLLSCVAWTALSSLPSAKADEDSHTYIDGEEVTLWVNKVGPYHNPQETYKFYSLPYCRPETAKAIKKKSEGLGAALEGNELKDSGIHVQFRIDQQQTKLCEITFTPGVAQLFSDAVRNHYWYQMYIDELPVWGMVGQLMQAGSDSDPGSDSDSRVALVDSAGAEGEQAFLYTHKSFFISHNQDRIIQVNLTSENPRPIIEGTTVPMTFSVRWIPTNTNFDDRFDRYLDFSFFEHQVHWFSIFNSFMMVVFLCCIVVLILMRTLKNDYLRYTAEGDDDLELDRVIDESGWKQVHGDVFRPPPYLALYSALIGTGYQLLVLVLLCILLAIAGSHYRVRGAVLSTFMGMHSVTSLVAGYASAQYYKRNGGRKWKLTMILTATLFPGACFVIAFILNFVAVAYGSLAAISVGTMLTMACIWTFIAVPLCVLGTILGRNTANKGDFPCRVNALRRPIPEHTWFTKPWVLALAGGILPFGSIFIELYFIFTSFWNYKFYYVYGFMLLVYIILFIVTCCVTIVSTYALLNAEDYRWQWTCFFSGGSTALYVFLYAVYYFYTKTQMYGFFQYCFYFGYVAIFCFALFLLCGTIGFIGTSMFVHHVYTYIKSD